MASETGKNKLDLTSLSPPVKKMKLGSDGEVEKVQQRTVATMCGAWRPDEVDGGLIFVFKTREECLSPNPTQESDYPENIQDFWEASLLVSDDDQVCRKLYFWLSMIYLLVSIIYVYNLNVVFKKSFP